ncbi:flagellar hook-length control protein FliK [Domibacillus epiphyticus]|uniref:Flagellar hook-length control protein-like C-terminal domain-containing protein n=1 Tax=Domibacillus epiphyticus TaxID=1714355 RepID=A0A1V2ACS7_9BACI|nr:flagellar hook-length control protein FliK [Domibacillus epiphyticus]OMP68604.1 hypothetical protein BTO28_00715 [Domibacillus epiphyticus]
MQATFSKIVTSGAGPAGVSSQNAGQMTSGTGFKQMLGSVQQSIDAPTAPVALPAVSEDFLLTLSELSNPVESISDIPGINPELAELAEQFMQDGEMPTMQELSLVLGIDAETLLSSMKQLASLLTDEQIIGQLPSELKKALESLKSDEEEGIPGTMPVMELAAVVQLIAANAQQIVKERDKQAAIAVMKAAQVLQQLKNTVSVTQVPTSTPAAEQTSQESKFLQSALQQAAVSLKKEAGPSPAINTRQTALQTAFTRYDGVGQPTVQPKVADTPLVKQSAPHASDHLGAVKTELSIARSTIGQDALNPVVHQMTKTEQFVMSVKTDPRPMNMGQFIEKFTQVLGNSNLMKTPNGTKLLIKLYPEQLGSLRIELLQQNGIMTAKILSSTQAVKELLEQNAHQLKNAFSQQNVAVDKIEVTNPETRQQMFERNSQDRNNGQRQQSEQQQPEQTTDEENGSFADFLTEIETEV